MAKLPFRMGCKLREGRQEAGLTLQGLADRSGVSKSLLSRLERDQGNPSVMTLWRICQVLGVSLTSLLAVPASDEMVVRRDRRRRLYIPRTGIEYQLLTPDLNRRIEMLWVEFEPGVKVSSERFVHEGEECVLVLEGTLEVILGERRIRLGAGDSMIFPSTVPHDFENPGPGTSVSVWAMTPPSF